MRTNTQQEAKAVEIGTEIGDAIEETLAEIVARDGRRLGGAVLVFETWHPEAKEETVAGARTRRCRDQ